MPLRLKSSLLLAALLPWASARAAQIEVDFSKPWISPEKPSPVPDSPRIVPVWTRENIWMPWKRWDPANPPKFEPLMRELALVMATGARGEGEFQVPDLYDGWAAGKGFDSTHPFFKTLKIFKAQGKRPFIDIGPVPKALSAKPNPKPGFFGWIVEQPSDYEKYYAFIKALFSYLHESGLFTLDEMRHWGYQLFREPDENFSWDPAGSKKYEDAENLAAYMRLYDYTLAGMRDAGLDVNLSPGNLMLPYTGFWQSWDTWTVRLYSWLGSNGNNQCPAHLHLPRIRSKTDTLELGFSAYGGSGQMGLDPRKLGEMTDKFRAIARQAFPGVPLRLTVGEGNLDFEKHLLRGEGTELGAAWNAAIYKIAEDAGLARYQQWGFFSADHVSHFLEHGGLPSAPYNVVAMYAKMENEKRLLTTMRRSDFRSLGSYLDGIASKSDAGGFHVLVFNYVSHRGATGSEEVEVRVQGLPPGRRYTVKHYRVDAEHSNYIPAWNRELSAHGLPPVATPFDACMEFQFSPAQKALWDSRKEYLRSLSGLAELPSDSAASDSQGGLAHKLDMIPNSVSLLEFTP